MMESEDVRDWKYKTFIKNDCLNEMQMAVLRVLKEIEPATSQTIASHMQVEINQVTGRIRELVDEGIVTKRGNVWNVPTNAWRTEWRTVKFGEQTTQKENKDSFLLNTEMVRLEKLIYKLKSTGNEHQINKIRGMLS